MASRYRFRRSLAIRPVTTEKHYINLGPSQVSVNALGSETIVAAVAVDDKNTSNEVRQGCSVKNIYVELWVNSPYTEASGADTNTFQILVEKTNEQMTDMVFVDLGLLNDYGNKKNVFYTSRGLAPNTEANPVPVMRGYISIPKGKQRFGLGDELKLQIGNTAATGDNLNYCGLVTYKEYY